jgi:cell division transport system ATP-binding protein
MIQMFDVYKVYPNKHSALTAINLHINKGDFTFLTGQSGAGKTTMINLIFCAERATKGQIVVKGINLGKIKKSRIPYLRRDIGVVFQDFKLLNSRTVFENVVFALEVTGARRAEIKRKAWQVLKLVGLQNRLDATPLELSGGEQQRIAIARAIINDPTILLADEPTGNLDSEITHDIMELFKNINNRGTTVVIATHNNTLAQEYATRHITLEKGRIINSEEQ